MKCTDTFVSVYKNEIIMLRRDEVQSEPTNQAAERQKEGRYLCASYWLSATSSFISCKDQHRQQPSPSSLAKSSSGIYCIHNNIHVTQCCWNQQWLTPLLSLESPQDQTAASRLNPSGCCTSGPALWDERGWTSELKPEKYSWCATSCSSLNFKNMQVYLSAFQTSEANMQFQTVKNTSH